MRTCSLEVPLATPKVFMGLFRVPYLAIFLAATIVALVIQLFPALGAATWRALDYRAWSPLRWLTLNIIALAVLFTARYSPQVRAALRRWKDRPMHRTNSQKE
jgi:hypothetical protein